MTRTFSLRGYAEDDIDATSSDSGDWKICFANRSRLYEWECATETEKRQGRVIRTSPLLENCTQDEWIPDTGAACSEGAYYVTAQIPHDVAFCPTSLYVQTFHGASAQNPGQEKN